MKILLVDDHAIVLEGIKALIEKSLRETTIQVTTEMAQAEAALATGDVDVMIADLDLRNESGLQLIQYAHSYSPLTKVIVYTMHEEPWTIRDIMDGMPDAAVLKSDNVQEIIAAIEAVALGRTYYSTALHRHFTILDQRPERLSEREHQILELTAAGLSTADTAQRLSITASTVEFHRHRIMQKLHVSNAAEMIKKASDMGWNAIPKRNTT